MWELPPSGRGRPPGVLRDSRKTEGGPASCSTGGRRAPRSDSQAGARPISAKGGREAQEARAGAAPVASGTPARNVNVPSSNERTFLPSY